jgi:predicted DNA-binding transcriptional regulator AlpA
MRRPRLDVDAIDAFLQAFDRDQGIVADPDEDDGEAGHEVPGWRSRVRSDAPRWGSSSAASAPGAAPGVAAEAADEGAYEAGGGAERLVWDDDAGAHGGFLGPAEGCRRRRLRISRRLEWGLRPGDLPPLAVLDGYRLDHRHHWRYAATGFRVPGARHRTLDRLWDFGRYEPVLVPQQTAACCDELRWCGAVGEWDEVPWAGRTVAAWRVDTDDWDDRARYSLGMDAPELAADRLLEVADVARLLAVGPSTVTAYLARGRLPAPQVRLGGRPAWSAPVLLAALTRRD